MRKIKILHIGLSSNIGGIETVVYSWFKHINNQLIQFDFINVSESSLAFEKEFLNAGCKIYKIESRKKNWKRSNSQLKEILLNNNYDFIHHHVMGITWPDPTIIAIKYTKTIPIIHNHTVWGNSNSIFRRFLNLLGHIRLVNRKYLKLACSVDSGNSVFKDNTFTVINNGVDLKEKSFNVDFRTFIRKKYQLDDECIVIGHVGRACMEKNYTYLLLVFSILYSKNKNYRCLLVGDVNKDSSVLSLVKSLNIEDAVIFVGKVRDVEKYYSAFDLFFFPSIYEGVSVSLIEAQCSGLPCVISHNISKESEVSNLIKYVDINNIYDGVKQIECTKINEIEIRENVKILKEYDINFTTDKLIKFYYDHIS